MYNSFKALQLMNGSGQDGEDPDSPKVPVCSIGAAERL